MTSKIVQVTVLVAAFGFAGIRASAEPAFVFKFDPGGCSFGWVDLGFNLDRRELVRGRPERANVLHISLGQPF